MFDWKRVSRLVLINVACLFAASSAQEVEDAGSQAEEGSASQSETAAETTGKTRSSEPKAAPKGRGSVAEVNSSPETSSVDAKVDQAAEGTRDPFAISPTLESYAAQSGVPGSRPVFTATPQPQSMPKMRMRMRGYLKSENGEHVALLEIIGGSVHIVREGETVGLYEIGLDAVIRIQTIDRLHMVVETGKLGQLIIVR